MGLSEALGRGHGHWRSLRKHDEPTVCSHLSLLSGLERRSPNSGPRWQEVAGRQKYKQGPSSRSSPSNSMEVVPSQRSTGEQDALQFEILILQEALEDERSVRASSVQDSFSEECCSAAAAKSLQSCPTLCDPIEGPAQVRASRAALSAFISPQS